VTTVFLWTLDAPNEISEGIFTLFLAVDLVSFAMVSYLYRHEKESTGISRACLATGGVLVVIFLFVSLILA